MKVFIFFILFTLCYCYQYEEYRNIHSAQQLEDFIQQSSHSVLIFVDKQVCKDESDEKCGQQRSLLEQIHNLCTTENIQFALSVNATLAEKRFSLYGSLPKLCYFRNRFPIIYSDQLSDLDRLQEWFSEVREKLTHTLDDQSFEHDTQASTGSTTGDWFILFKKSNESHGLVPVWEATSHQFRNRVIFAYVDIDVNPVLQQRFHLFTLPSLILFKQGKMHRYEGTSWKQTAFAEFIEHGYQKVKVEAVPPELSALTQFLEKVVRFIPMYFIVIPMICLVAVLLILVSGFAKEKKTTTQRTPFQVKID